MYCEGCGEEICIVPDFDPDLENSIIQTLNNIAEEFAPDPELDEFEKEESNHSGFLMWCIPVLLILVGVCTAFVGVYRYQTTSVGYQVKQAAEAVKANNYSGAIESLQRAYSLDETQVSMLFEIADYYYLSGNVDDSILTLLSIPLSEHATDDDIMSAYDKVVATYINSGEYEKISQLIAGCGNDMVVSKYRDYLSKAPEFGYTEGSYEEIIPLKIISEGSGQIYYTLDGTIPDEKSNIYTAPIMLDIGMTTVQAVYINNYGVRSEVITGTYEIDVAAPSTPEVNLVSGTYQTPQVIEIYAPQDTTVYYTFEQKEPNQDCILYNGPIALPRGISNFRCIAYNEEGVASEVVTRSYELTLVNAVPEVDVINRLLVAFIQAGKLTDAEGHAEGVAGRYTYEISCVVHNDAWNTDFFIIPESYVDPTGIATKTGAFYAADIYTGQLFKCGQVNSVTYEIQGDLMLVLSLQAEGVLLQ